MKWHAPPKGQITEHFSWREAACRCCGRINDEEEVRLTAEWLETIREALGGQPLHILSWCRCPTHNRSVGGAQDSYHMLGQAVDISARRTTPRAVQRLLAGLSGGLGCYPGFTHVDRGPWRRWRG